MFKIGFTKPKDGKTFFGVFFSFDGNKLVKPVILVFTVDTVNASLVTKVDNELAKVYVKPWGKPLRSYL